jgi:four helix bundle protein
MEKQKILSYEDLDVYKRSYTSCIKVMKEIVPKLPLAERYDLKDQLSRSCKAIPRLIAEGFAKKYQRLGFQKYLTDALGESNETAVSLTQCRDLYPEHLDLVILTELIKEYTIIGKQLYKLKVSWTKFNGPKPDYES